MAGEVSWSLRATVAAAKRVNHCHERALHVMLKEFAQSLAAVIHYSGNKTVKDPLYYRYPGTFAMVHMMAAYGIKPGIVAEYNEYTRDEFAVRYRKLQEESFNQH